MRKRFIGLSVLPLAFVCCSGGAQERGWIGGRFQEVSATWPHAIRPDRVDGMPVSLPANRGLLVTSAHPETPVARAGIQAGDLIVYFNGRPTPSPLEFRREIEKCVPGRMIALEVWRSGIVQTTQVKVGKEIFNRHWNLKFGLLISPHFDLWPFDDGINLFGVVGIKTDSNRYDLVGVEGQYLRETAPDSSIQMPLQETTQVTLLPFSVGSSIRVERQEAIP